MSDSFTSINESGGDSINTSARSDETGANDAVSNMAGTECHFFNADKKQKILVTGYTFACATIGSTDYWVCEVDDCSTTCEVQTENDGKNVIKIWNEHNHEPDENLGASCQVIKSNRGGDKLFSGGYSYHLERNRDYCCAQRRSKKCRSRIGVIEVNGIFKISKYNDHSHVENAKLAPVAEFRQKLKRAAENSTAPPSKIIKTAKIATDVHVVPSIGEDKTLQRLVHRHKPPRNERMEPTTFVALLMEPNEYPVLADMKTKTGERILMLGTINHLLFLAHSDCGSRHFMY
jgi:hypothetical protein